MALAEDLKEKTEICIQKYEEAYKRKPNAVILGDHTFNVFKNNGMLENLKEAREEYSGLGLKLDNFVITIYWFGRIDLEELGELGSRRRKVKLHGSGGIYPLILATRLPIYDIERLFKGKKFRDPLSCDIGVPKKQLEQQLERKIKIKN